MNDFEIQRHLRDLRVAREPAHDLWPGIRDRLGAAPAAVPPVRRPRWLPLSAAAALLVATAAGLLVFAAQQPPMTQVDAQQPSVSEQIRRARELAMTGNPDIAGAEVVLDSANIELEQALQEQPDAVFLVGLINRTHAQRRKLARLGLQAS